MMTKVKDTDGAVRESREQRMKRAKRVVVNGLVELLESNELSGDKKLDAVKTLHELLRGDYFYDSPRL